MSAAPKLEAVERRASERFPAHKSAFIHADGTAIPCVIENISEGGALLVLTQRIKLPARFELTSPEDQITLPCKRQRTAGLTVAVEFIRD
jgi:hypothetical protein